MTTLTPEQFRRYLRTLTEERGSKSALARSLGLSPSYVSEVLVGRREPGPKMLDAMGMERIVRYREKQP